MGETVDFLIVGQGLAGSLLAWELRRNGSRVRIINSENPHAASPVSAGILNPVTGKRIVKSWNLDKLHPIAMESYQALESLLGFPVFEEKPIVRLFENEDEHELWETRKADSGYEPWLGERLPPRSFSIDVKDTHGSFEILGGGWLSIGSLVEALGNTFTEKKLLIKEPFHYRDLDLNSSREFAQWKNFRARKIVFCEGYQAARNPWFEWLDYRLSRGEILDIETKAPFHNRILNRGKWILPTGEKTARVGSTYSWEGLESGPTISGVREIMESLSSFNQGEFPIISHRAGIRPGTNDSKPYLGTHPMESRLAILNGLGSKGSLYGPPAARELARHLTGYVPIDESWDIRRRLSLLKDPLNLP